MLEYPASNIEDGKVIVLLYGGYQNNCSITLDNLEMIGKNHKDIKVVKVNTSKYHKIKEKYSVTKLPTVLFLENGNLISSIKDSFNFHSLEQAVKKNFVR